MVVAGVLVRVYVEPAGPLQPPALHARRRQKRASCQRRAPHRARATLQALCRR